MKQLSVSVIPAAAEGQMNKVVIPKTTRKEQIEALARRQMQVEVTKARANGARQTLLFGKISAAVVTRFKRLIESWLTPPEISLTTICENQKVVQVIELKYQIVVSSLPEDLQKAIKAYKKDCHDNSDHVDETDWRLDRIRSDIRDQLNKPNMDRIKELLTNPTVVEALDKTLAALKSNGKSVIDV